MIKKAVLVLTYLVAVFILPAHAVVRIKDIARVDGIRENQIYGYGLVVGLNGTGDKNMITTQSMATMMNQIDVNVDRSEIKVKNVAAVMVTAKLPPFARSGQLLDVTVSSIGDAKSLEGGTLIMTPMNGPDGNVYAVAQGAISVGGYAVSAGGTGGNSSTQKNHPTVGRIPNGAIIEQEINFEMDTSKIDLFFNSYSLGDVVKAKTAINSFMGVEVARIKSPSSVEIYIPVEFRGSYFDFLNTVLNLEIQPETYAKIVLDEKTGTIVIGSDVRISTVAVAHGNLTITISNQVEVSQPNSFTDGQTVTTVKPVIDAAEDNAKLMVVPEGVTVSDLVKALNAIGVRPRDLINILQAIKAAGALHADLEVI